MASDCACLYGMRMPKDFVYFDLETQRSAGDVGGWDKKCDMGMSIGVTYSTASGEYRVFGEQDVDALIDQLRRADLVIGYNHINFDYQVLMGYTCLDLPSQVSSLDLCTYLDEAINHRPKLDKIAEASLGCGKTAEGLQAIKWWREGKIMEIARYCCFDVKVTKLVHEYGVEHGLVKFFDTAGHEKVAAVEWPSHL